MIFADLAMGDALFVDANTLTYHFEPHPRWDRPARNCSSASRMGSLSVTPPVT
jgi:hypothetical protein